MKKPY